MNCVTRSMICAAPRTAAQTTKKMLLPRQRHHRVAHDGDQRGRLQRDRAGEVEMMLRHADRNGRRHQRAHLLAGAAGDHLGGQRVGADQARGAMLLGRADGDDDAGLGLEIVVDELPGFELKLHEP